MRYVTGCAVLLGMIGSTGCGQSSSARGLATRLAPNVDAVCEKAMSCTPAQFGNDTDLCRLHTLMLAGDLAIGAIDRESCEQSIQSLASCLLTVRCFEFALPPSSEDGCSKEGGIVERTCVRASSTTPQAPVDPEWLPRDSFAITYCERAVLGAPDTGNSEVNERRYELCADLVTFTRAASAHVYGQACGAAYLDLVECRTNTYYPTCSFPWSFDFGCSSECPDDVTAAREACDGFAFLAQDSSPWRVSKE